MFVEGASMSLLEAKSQVSQFLAALYPVDPENSLAAPPEEMASLNLLAGELEVETNWDLAHLTGGLYLSSPFSIRGDCGRFREVRSAVSDSGPSSVAALMSLDINRVVATSSASIL